MNKKTLFLVIALIAMLILVTSVNAATDNTNTSTTHSISEKTTTAEPVVKEKIENTQTKQKTDKTQDKTITKTNKIKENKKTSQTFDVYDSTSLTNANTEIQNSVDETTFIVNLQEGTYSLSSTTYWGDKNIPVTNPKNITIEGNNQIINCGKNLQACPDTLTIKNLNLNAKTLVLKGQLNIINSTITINKLSLYASGILYLDDNSTINVAEISANDPILPPIYTNNTNITTTILNQYNSFVGKNNLNEFELKPEINIIVPEITTTIGSYNTGDLTLSNTNINKTFLNYGTTTLNKCTLNSPIYNLGTLIINDECILGENFQINNTGTIITNLTLPFPEETPNYDGNKEINNENIITDITIPTTGNITLTNCQINAKITNQGNLTLINCSLSNNNMITTGSDTGFLLENNGNATVIDCIMENNTFNGTYGAIFNNGIMNINNSKFNNNSLGYSKDEEGIYGIVEGYGTVITNKNILNINNSTFQNGYAGVAGAAINNEGILTINKTNFINNTVNTLGSAIYNNRNSKSDIYNSKFIDNLVDLIYSGIQFHGGGAIADNGNINEFSGKNQTITNCTFENNRGEYTGQTIVGVGEAGGALLLGGNTYTITDSKFINNNISNAQVYYYFKTNTTISNSIFENSEIIDRSGLNIINNTFKNNSGISKYLEYNYPNKKIIGNNFTDNNRIITYYHNGYITAPNTISLIVTDSEVTKQELLEYKNITIQNNYYTNTSINDEITLNIPNKIYTGEPITITGTYTLLEPENYDANILEQNQFEIYINGELIQTVDTLEFIITPTTGTMMLTIQPTISQTRKTEAIRATTLTDIIITPENYNEYIYEGKLIGVGKDSKILFAGTFTNKDEISIDTQDIIIDGSNASFTNTIFKLEATGITLQNMNINNTQTEYPIQNTKDNNIITGNTITLTNTEGKTAAIYNKASNTEITHNTLIIDGPANSIDHNYGLGIADTQAILLIGGDKNTIIYNTIKVTSSGKSGIYGTVEGITNHQKANNTKIQYNNITVTGNGKFNYGLDTLGNVENITITDNNILVTGERYTAGIQTGDGAQNIEIHNNNIKCICQNNTPVDEEAITYGIVTINIEGAYKSPNNINITENTIDLIGTANYGIEIYKTTNTQIKNNNITVTGLQSMGIGYAHSPNSTVTDNTIKTNGDSTIQLGGVTEEIQPSNVGIQLQQESDNILIENNTIQTYDVATQDNCINVETSNVTIKNNNLTSSNKVGDNTITTTQPDTTTIEDNNAIEQNSTTQTTTEDLTTGDSTTLTARFYDDTYTPISSGKAIFRVNGKTLRDDQGNVIYADVINGRAELPDVNITQEWTKEGTTIHAVYIGDDNNDPITTKPTNINVTKPEATITLEAPTEATAGQEITLKATVTDGENNITSGRVAFKLNGKTLKNAEGKALYANVENGIATITYTIPEKTKAKEYTLTAVFTDTVYDRVEAESKLNVVKA